MNEVEHCIASFQALELEKYYRMLQHEFYLPTSFVEQFHYLHDIKKILMSWWLDDKRFFVKNDGVYAMTNSRYPYKYVVALVGRLHGVPNCVYFKEAWVPMVYIIVIGGIHNRKWFNWAAIFSYALKRPMEKA